MRELSRSDVALRARLNAELCQRALSIALDAALLSGLDAALWCCMRCGLVDKVERPM